MTISSFVTWLATLCIDVISPPACAYCKTLLPHRTVFCISCMAKLQPVVSFTMPITATKSVKVFATAAYKEPLKTLIMAKSWSDHVASAQLAELIWQRTVIQGMKCDYLVPVPLHWTRYAKRGFNQAQEIAQGLAKKSGVPCRELLKRIKRTPFQSMLPSSQRITNVADAFALKKNDVTVYKDKHIMLVDDLFTTGATIRACAKMLYELKPASITVVVAARVTD